MGLSADDFSAKVDGHLVPLLSADWIELPAGSATTASASSPVPRSVLLPGASVSRQVLPSEPTTGRLIVLFFQVDPNLSRITGWMRMWRRAVRFVMSCSPTDEIAVLSYDSRLKLRQDFTVDHGKVDHAIKRTGYWDNPPDPAPGPYPSLARDLDFSAARRATRPEDALRLIAEALAKLPGNKQLLFFGWGLGNWSPGFGLVLGLHYARAAEALIESRTSVFSLDVTSADFHSLEGGLEAVAADTGGFYVKTNVFPDWAMKKVARALSGYYELAFKRPQLPRGFHRVEVEVRGHPQAEVYARGWYRD